MILSPVMFENREKNSDSAAFGRGAAM